MATNGLGVGKGHLSMSGKSGHRSWGKIKKQPTKTVSYQASFIGPDLRRHYAPTTFSSKMNAEAWLARERDYKERCGINGETWKPPVERKLGAESRSATAVAVRQDRHRPTETGRTHAHRIRSQVVATHRTETWQVGRARSDHHGGSGVVRRFGPEAGNAQRPRLRHSQHDLQYRCS